MKNQNDVSPEVYGLIITNLALAWGLFTSRIVIVAYQNWKGCFNFYDDGLPVIPILNKLN